ncbi:MAG: DUF447 family protein [Caldiserica bacterium]|nr:DUF447 family protein [Caldisericota bacterium]MDH7562557.1 DUF447 family protein [Caldisericota bacterium]
MEMILEVIFSTVSEDGLPNFAPMGAIWGEKEMVVRPFLNTRTFQNLRSSGYGVASITDDVLVFAKTALQDFLPPHFPARSIQGFVLDDCCFWRELKVKSIKERGERAEVTCEVVDGGWKRDFLGFNRARNAIIELVILATRLHLQPPGDLEMTIKKSGEIVEKTGGEREKEAFHFVQDFIKGGRGK